MQDKIIILNIRIYHLLEKFVLYVSFELVCGENSLSRNTASHKLGSYGCHLWKKVYVCNEKINVTAVEN